MVVASPSDELLLLLPGAETLQLDEIALRALVHWSLCGDVGLTNHHRRLVRCRLLVAYVVDIVPLNLIDGCNLSHGLSLELCLVWFLGLDFSRRHDKIRLVIAFIGVRLEVRSLSTIKLLRDRLILSIQETR